MVGTPVKDVRGGQAVALHLTAEVTALAIWSSSSAGDFKFSGT